METNLKEEVRELAEACLAFVNGDGLKSAFQIDPKDMIAVRKLVKLADEQRVMSIVCFALNDEPWKHAFSKCGIEAAKKGSIYYLFRSMSLRAQLKEIDEALGDTNIFPILLKGSVTLFDGLYPNLGMRHMEDIDFLVDDCALLEILVDIGYLQINGEVAQWVDSNGAPSLQSGEHHWPPLIRPSDFVSLEPHHKAVSLRYEKWLPNDFSTNVLPLKGCRHLRCPSLKNQLILNLIHVLKHNRDTMSGAIFLRGIIECELMFERLSSSDKLDLEKHFASTRRLKMFHSWRALADWTLRKDDAARYSSVSAFLLITEFQLRCSNYGAVFAFGVFHRFIAFFDIRFWSSGLYYKTGKRLWHGDFWSTVFNNVKRAIGISRL